MPDPSAFFTVSVLASLSVGAVASVSFTESSLTLLPGDATDPFYSGVAMGVVDVDGDGKDDIIRFQDGKQLHVHHQSSPGSAFGTYQGMTFNRIRIGLAVADHDDNGKRDLVSGGYSDGTHLLTANAAGTSYALTTLPDTDIVMQGMNFADINNDGLIDVFACDDVDDCHKYRNMGDGTFTLDHGLIETLLPGPVAGQDPPNAGNYASIWTDYDNDGDQDLYLSKCWGQFGALALNDPNQLARINRLFRQEADGSFTEVGTTAGLASMDQSWCSDFADVDLDGDLDVFVVNHVVNPFIDHPCQFYENQGDGTFQNATSSSGIAFTDFGIQCLFRDFDNDGHQDLLVSASEIAGNTGTCRLFLNDGDGTFTEQTNVFSTTTTGSGTPITYLHSFAVGDLNSDGWLDIYAGRARGFSIPTSNRDLLFLNDGGSHHYLQVQLKGEASNPDGIGARLELHGAWGVQLREVRSGEGYGVMHSLTQHFGLGATTDIDRLVVRWPSGTVDIVDDPIADQVLVLAEGTSPASFADWQSLCFTPTELLDDSVSGPDGDPDFDGLVNLFEWYLRTHPKQPRSRRDPIAGFSIDEPSPGQRRLTLTIRRQPVSGVQEFAEITSSLSNWMSGVGEVEVLSDTDKELVLRSKLLGQDFAAIRFALELEP